MENVEAAPAATVTEIPVPETVAPKKRVVLAIPGENFSHNFLIAWTRTLYTLWQSNRYEVVVAPGVSSFVSFARMKTMGLDVLRGKDQKPFNGMDYDVYLSLDSDVVYTPQHIIELIESTAVHPVVAGYYMMSDGEHFAAVKEWDTDFFARTGTFQFLKPDDINNWKNETSSKYMPVSYVGMGFFACRKEVLDSLEYPYFNHDLMRITTPEGKELVDMCSEDVAFCKNIQEKGYTVYLHTDLRVGHDKRVIL